MVWFCQDVLIVSLNVCVSPSSLILLVVLAMISGMSVGVGARFNLRGQCSMRQSSECCIDIIWLTLSGSVNVDC